MTLTIKRRGKPDIIARDIAWSLEPASLSVARNGSLLLNTSHVGIGRSPHEQTLTIAYRSGAYQVVGITRANWDRIEPNSGTRCDINLLTGRGTVSGGPRGGERRVRVGDRARPITAWSLERKLPDGCFVP